MSHVEKNTTPGETMDEREWLTSNDYERMLMRCSRVSQRKKRLFYAACCRMVPDVLTQPTQFKAVDLFEQLADTTNPTTEANLTEELIELGPFGEILARPTESVVGMCLYCSCMARARREGLSGNAHRKAVLETWKDNGKPEVAELLRDTVDNPFRPLNPYVKTWNKPKTAKILIPAEGWEFLLDNKVSRLGPSAYEHRREDGSLENDRLLVLADRLEEAGCREENLLSHLRKPGKHYRGYWSLDLVCELF